MKHIILFGLTTFIAFFLISCKKNSVLTNDINAIPGKWNIINDSTFVGIGANNHPVSYTGQSGDYFDFRTDRNVYIKEGATLDTLSYSLTSDTTILIASFGIVLNGVPETGHITNLTAHNATINFPVEITPGGEFGRKVNLNR